MEYCAPKQLKNYKRRGSCYDKSVLEKVARSYNRYFPDEPPIENIETMSFSKLWKTLQTRMKKYCGNDEVCWVSRVGLDYDAKIDDYLRPKTPADWRKNPNTWLTNFNIEAVMYQYEGSNPNYKFLGVFPVDFRSKDSYNECLYEETCKINIEKLYDEGIRYVGMIINLDRHDEPGSHWTSLFVCIDPYKSCFGAFYYDSVTGKPPKEMYDFMKDLKKQAMAFRKKLTGKTYPFALDYNKVRHQYGHSECGVFSIYYQIRWIKSLKENGDSSFMDIVGPKITDEQVSLLRKLLFRPIYQFKKVAPNKD